VHLRRRGFTLQLSILPFGHDALIEALRQIGSATVLYAGNDKQSHGALHPADVGCTVGSPDVAGAVSMRSAGEFVAFLLRLARLRLSAAGAMIDTVVEPDRKQT
jgi:hypothetical protein